MTASVTIHCESIPDAIVAPVQSVYSHGGKYYAFVYDAGQWDARPIKVGPTNDKFFVIENGLKEGERIAMNPRGYLDRVELPALPSGKTQMAEKGAPPKNDAAAAEGEVAKQPTEAGIDKKPTAEAAG
jgi:HlyD family secretion protein